MKIETIENPSYYIYFGNCVSIGKKPRKDWKPTEQWAVKMLHSLDSTVELFDMYIYDEHCRGDISSHIVRATKGHPRFVVQSRRPDWIGKERLPLDKVCGMFFLKASPYSLIEIARQRLCSCASKVDQLWITKVKSELKNQDDIFLRTLADSLVPDCVFRGNVCHKLKCCGLNPHYTELEEK